MDQLRSLLNAKVGQLHRLTRRHPRSVNIEVNRHIGVRTRRPATEGQLREGLRCLEERLRALITPRRASRVEATGPPF
jgi:hypothetical protein